MWLAFDSSRVPFKGWACCWFSICSEGFYPGSPLSFLNKNQHSKFHFHQDRATAWANVPSCLYIVIYFNLLSYSFTHSFIHSFTHSSIYLSCRDNAKICLKFSGFKFFGHRRKELMTPVVIVASWGRICAYVMHFPVISALVSRVFAPFSANEWQADWFRFVTKTIKATRNKTTGTLMRRMIDQFRYNI